MKKVIVLIFICSLFMTAAHAQKKFGIKGGLTMANLTFETDNHASADFALGGHAAVFMKTGKGLFGFQPEVMWIQKGTRINSTENASYAQLSMNYIDVPLLLRISINLKVVELYFNLGAYGGYWLSGKSKEHYYDATQSKWVTDKETYEFDSDHDVRYDAGAIGGVGVRALFIMFEVRYGHGFIDVFDSEYSTDKQTNSYLNFSLGFTI